MAHGVPGMTWSCRLHSRHREWNYGETGGATQAWRPKQELGVAISVSSITGL